MGIEIRVPTLGESVTEATIGRWFEKAGEVVAADEPLVELETDKVTVEVPAPASGVLAEISAKDGETVQVGAVLGSINESAGGKAGRARSAQGRGSGTCQDRTRTCKARRRRARAVGAQARRRIRRRSRDS